MLQETADEGGAGEPYHPLAAVLIGAHPQQHVLLPDRHDPLVGNRRPVRIA